MDYTWWGAMNERREKEAVLYEDFCKARILFACFEAIDDVAGCCYRES